MDHCFLPPYSTRTYSLDNSPGWLQNATHAYYQSELIFDADIEGPAIIVVSLFTAIIAGLLVIVHFFVAARDEGNFPSIYANPVDTKIIAFISKRFGSKKSVASTLIAIEKVTLSLSDTQLVSGLAILISIWSQYEHTSLYHWDLAVRLAWLSSVTHLATLTTLREYFRQNIVSRNTRIMLMLLLLLLLIISLIPTGYTARDITASCFWYGLRVGNTLDRDGDNTNYGGPIASIVLLSASFLVRIIKQTVTGSRRARNVFRKIPATYLRRILESCHRSKHFYPLYWAGVPVFWTLQILADIWESFLFESLWLLYAVIWGVYSFALLRFSDSVRDTKHELLVGAPPPPKDSTSKLWSFGQTFSIVVLLLPALTMLEITYGKVRETERPRVSSSPIQLTPIVRDVSFLSSNAQLNSSNKPVSSDLQQTSISTGTTHDIPASIYATKYYRLQLVVVLSSTLPIMACLVIFVNNYFSDTTFGGLVGIFCAIFACFLTVLIVIAFVALANEVYDAKLSVFWWKVVRALTWTVSLSTLSYVSYDLILRIGSR